MFRAVTRLAMRHPPHPPSSSTAAASSSTVLVRSYPKTTVVTLNREAALNSLNDDMIQSLRGFYATVHDIVEPDSTLIVLKGAGTKAFCAGGDVVSLVKDEPRGTRASFFYNEYQVNNMIATMKQPQVSLWNGVVMGGGFGVSIHGRYRMATESTVFAMPETGIGLFPDVGGSFVLPRLRAIEGLGLYLGLTGARLKGADVFHAGLANCYVRTQAQLAEVVQKLCSLEDVKQVDSILAHATAESGVHDVPFTLAKHAVAIQKYFGDHHRGIADVFATLAAADTSDAFAHKTLSTLTKCSPLAICATFKLLRHGATLPNVTTAFEFEYNATQHLMASKDFNSGVTALLIDKSASPPRWEHSSISEVPECDGMLERRSDAVAWHPTRPFPGSAKL